MGNLPEDVIRTVFKGLYKTHEFLGEDGCDFQALDDAEDQLYRDLFDLLGYPQGKKRVMFMRSLHNEVGLEGCNIQHPSYVHEYPDVFDNRR